MPSSYYTVDKELGQQTINWAQAHVSKFFLSTNNLQDLCDDIHGQKSKELMEFNSNMPLRTKSEPYFQQVGFFQNGYNGTYYYLSNEDILLIPDFIRVHKGPGRQIFAAAVKILQNDLHTDVDEVYNWKDAFYTEKPMQLRIKTLWDEKEINQFIASVKENNLRSQFGKIEYRGRGSISALDDYELGVFNLSHGLQDIVDHFELWFDDDVEKVYAYTRHHKLTRSAVKQRKDFPSPYQTIPRDQLSESEDTVVGLGQKGNDTAVLSSIWWDDYHNDRIDKIIDRLSWDDYCSKEKNRFVLMKDMERLGYVENRPLSPYGLLYKEVEDATGNSVYIIPDFIRVNDRHPSAIILVNNTASPDLVSMRAIKNVFSSNIKFDFLVASDAALEDLNTILDRKNIKQCSCVVNLSKIDVPYDKQLFQKKKVSVGGTIYKHITSNEHYESDIKVIEAYWNQHQHECIGRFLTEGSTNICTDLNVNQYVFSDFISKQLKGMVFDENYIRESLFPYLSDQAMVPKTALRINKKMKYKHIYLDQHESKPSCIDSLIKQYQENQEIRISIRNVLAEYGYFENRFDNIYGLLYFENKKATAAVIPEFISFQDNKIYAISFCDFNLTQQEFRQIEQVLSDQSTTTSTNIVWSGKEFEFFETELNNRSWDISKNRVFYRGKDNGFWRLANRDEFYKLREIHGDNIGLLASKLGESPILVKEVNWRIPSEKPNQDFDFDFPQFPMSRSGYMHSKVEMEIMEPLKALEIFANDGSAWMGYQEIAFDVYGIKEMIPDYVSKDRKIVVEFDGSYYHRDPDEALFRKLYYDKQHIQCSIIWEHELEDFLSCPPSSIEELLKRFPCSWRNEESCKAHGTTHEYKAFLSKLKTKIKQLENEE